MKDPPVEKSTHKRIVDNYLDTLEFVRSVDTGSFLQKHPKINKLGVYSLFTREAGILWTLLRQAHIFELPPAAYCQFHHLVDVYTTEQIAKMKWISPENIELEKRKIEEEYTDHYRLVSEAGNQVPFPERLPFGVSYFGWGEGIQMSRANMVAHGLGELRCHGTLYAHLISESGLVVEFIKPAVVNQEIPILWITQYTKERGWEYPYSLLPWILSLTVNAINEHRVVVTKQVPSFSDRWSFDRRKKKIGEKKTAFLPPPFYTVDMKDEVVSSTVQAILSSGSRSVDWTHQWDVRGHDHVKIQYGFKPIDKRVEDDLKNKGYQIFTVETLSEEMMSVLLERARPLPQPNEWVAIKKTWVDPYVKGPRDRPYIPSTRRGSKDPLDFYSDTKEKK